MKIFLPLLACATLALANSDILSRARRSLEAETRAGMVAGHTSNRKKVTEGSLAMGARNALYRRSLDLMVKEEGRSLAEAHEAVTRSMEDEEDDICEVEEIECDSLSLIQRTIDGTCNNLENPTWGAKGAVLLRNVTHNYQSGSRAIPRGGYDFGAAAATNPSPAIFTKEEFEDINDVFCPVSYAPTLPNARVISSTVHNEEDVPSDFTHLLTIFGQFLDHDMSISGEEHVEDCCDHPEMAECIPIPISPTDNFYGVAPNEQSCLQLTRSVEFCEDVTVPREQFNEITSFIDASNVYGSDDARAASLRAFDSGLLLTDELNLLPTDATGARIAGDTRADENPALASLHTLFLREHNSVAKAILKGPNPPSDELNGEELDEEVYQRARAIVIAEMQNIVYDGFLPIVLGGKSLRKNKIDLSNDVEYSEEVNPSVVNVFSTAAFRFGHTLVQGIFEIFDFLGETPIDEFNLSDEFFNLTRYTDDSGLGFDRIVKGLTKQAGQTFDRHVTSELTNRLFPEENNGIGSDLVARNIVRGREHGLPGYNAYRRMCKLKAICSWDDRPREIEEANWNLLRSVYEATTEPADIDIFAAGLAEKSVNGGLLGTTFNCIQGNQFRNFRQGDRFFFTNKGLPTSLNDDQINALRERTIRDIICENTEVVELQENAFLPVSKRNRVGDCDETNILDFSLF